MAWLSDWKRRMPITIDPTVISGGLSDNLVNFPILITLSSGTGINNLDVTRIFDELSGNSEKIAITISDGVTQCPVEIESWQIPGEKAILWTKVPTITSGTSTRLYLYYNAEKEDNTGYVGETTSSGAKNVWSDDYEGVWHLAQDPSGGSGSIKDSTDNANHGDPSGFSSSNLVDSLVGKGIDFEAGGDLINIGDKASLEPTYLTLSVLCKTDDYTESLNGGVVKGNVFANVNNYAYRIDFNSGDVNLRITDGLSHHGADLSLDDNDWHLWTLTYDGQRIKAWKDLTVTGTEFSGTIEYNQDSNDFCIGGRTTGQYSFNGINDGVYLSSVSRSDDYIKTFYYSVFNQLVYFEDVEYNVGAAKESEVVLTVTSAVNVYGEIPDDKHDSYVSIYYGSSDGGTVASNWDSSVYAGLKTSGSNFSVTLSGIDAFRTYYYRFYTTYSGSEPSESWSPSYSFFISEGRILKGTSNNFVAVMPEPNSTFYNPSFACVSYGSGGGLNAVRADSVVGFWPTTVSGAGNTIKEDPSDLASVR